MQKFSKQTETETDIEKHPAPEWNSLEGGRRRGFHYQIILYSLTVQTKIRNFHAPKPSCTKFLKVNNTMSLSKTSNFWWKDQLFTKNWSIAFFLDSCDEWQQLCQPVYHKSFFSFELGHVFQEMHTQKPLLARHLLFVQFRRSVGWSLQPSQSFRRVVQPSYTVNYWVSIW